ncbi:MAG: tetratricopeptide repeat protein [Acidobacteriota bacterium]
MSRTWPAAVMVAVMSLPVWPASTRSLNEQGNEAYRRTRYDDALRSYTEAQVDSPDSPIIEYNIGNVFYRQQAYDRASEAYGKALENAEGTLARDVFYNLGDSRFMAQDFGGAVQAYTQALRIDPSDRDAKRNLEIALARLEQPPPQGGDDDRQEENREQESAPQSPRPSQPQREQADPDPPRPQPREGELSPEEAERLLEALAQEEQDNIKRQRRKGRVTPPGGKDW